MDSFTLQLLQVAIGNFPHIPHCLGHGSRGKDRKRRSTVIQEWTYSLIPFQMGKQDSLRSIQQVKMLSGLLCLFGASPRPRNANRLESKIPECLWPTIWHPLMPKYLAVLSTVVKLQFVCSIFPHHLIHLCVQAPGICWFLS